MKVKHLNLLAISIFVVVVTALSIGFYLLERATVLQYIATSTQQSTFRLEEGITQSIQKNEKYRLQSILDQSAAIDSEMATVSLSLDGKTIFASSSRSKIGCLNPSGFTPITEVMEKLSSEGKLQYVSAFEYYHDDHRHKAWLFVELDRHYVFGQLNRLGWLYGIGFFVVMMLMTVVSFAVIRKVLSAPLEEVALMASHRDQNAKMYFIQELSDLSRTLASTFHNIWMQQIKIEEAMEETRYLDGILRTVAEINEYLISSDDVNSLMQKCTQRLSEHEGYGGCWIALKDGDTLEVSGAASGLSRLLPLGTRIGMEAASRDLFEPVIEAYETSRIVMLESLMEQECEVPWNLIAKEFEYDSFIALPLMAKVDEKAFGVLSIYSNRSEGFRPKEVQMLEELAGDIGFAVNAYVQREEFRRHLSIDEITGLLNRMSLIDHLSEHSATALAILNIDRFSDINDVYGVGIGDQVLARYGQWLQQKIATTQGISVYKLGSDEYALVFDDAEDIDNRIAFLEEIITKTAEELFVINQIQIILSISVGFAHTSNKILEHATRALKQAKLDRKSFHIYTPSLGMKKEQEKNIEWYKEIREALDESRFVPYFQPIVDNVSREIVKYEALIRLIKRDGSVVSPLAFLEIAKKMRLYPLLTKVMVDKVFQRFESMSIPVSINLSTEDLGNQELAKYLEDSIVSRKIGHLIIFEILESDGIDNYEEVSQFVERFKAIGCSFAIDDFGSGYSNFDHLLRLNIDTLKIDGSLIKNLPYDHNSQIIVRHICQFAREMGMSTVAEFVANEAIYRKVVEAGIDTSQGYYFYEPAEHLH